MKNKLALFLFLACSPTIIMTMSKKSNNKHHQHTSQNVQWPTTIHQITRTTDIVEMASAQKNISDYDSESDFREQTIINTQQNAINMLPTLQEQIRAKYRSSEPKIKFDVKEKLKICGWTTPFIIKKDTEHYYFNPLQKTDDNFEYYKNVYKASCKEENEKIMCNIAANCRDIKTEIEMSRLNIITKK